MARAPAAEIPTARPSAADTLSASSLSDSDFPALGGASSSKAPAWGSKQKANSLPRVDKVGARHQRTYVSPGYMPCLPTGPLQIAHNSLPGVAECELIPQGFAAKNYSALLNSLDATYMPMHVLSISSVFI